MSAGRPLAGFGARLGAYLLDGLLYGLLLLPFIIASVVLFAAGLDECTTDARTDEIVCNGAEETGLVAAGVLVLVAGAILVIVIYLRALARTGQTWGRRIVGIAVVNADTGGPPGWGKAIGRQLFAAVISSYVLYLGYLWMIWDSKNQTWHDKVAGTLVVRS
jgi:uncharacterized RDD family membrane protein YckC